LQNTLGNVFGGIALIIDKSIKVGDVVKLDDNTMGTVMDIGLRSTRIKNFDNEMVIVPNGDLASKKIQNFAPPDPSGRVVVPFSVAYGSDPDKVKKAVLKNVKKLPGVKLDDPEKMPFVWFLEMGDSSLKCKLYFHVMDYKTRFTALDAANTMVYNELKKAKIKIPFPQMDVHLKKK
jgi:MscS family membrane protein